MDLATVLGFVLGWIIILIVMLVSGSLLMYWDLLSLVIVFGGAICSSMMRWPLGNMIGCMGVAMDAVMYKVDDPAEIIDQICELSNTARKESILALEKVSISNEFLAKGIRMLVDGQSPETVELMLKTDIKVLEEKIKDGKGLFEDLGESAPAFGMIGTVIGLIVIMANLSDPSKIGPGLAVALVTTLYGSLIANMMFIPIAKKLKYRGGERIKVCQIILSGVEGIINAENPRNIRERLEAYVDAA